MRVFFFLLILFFSFSLKAQPVADFSIPSTVCIGEQITPTNNSTGSVMEWDFCQGDLGFAPLVEASALVAGNANIGLDIVKDGNNYFGFVTDATNNTITRLNYGPNVNSSPAVASLGSIFGATNVTPYDIEIVYDNGNWYGFVYGVSTTIVRLDFGTSLTNTPTSQVLISDGAGSTSGLDVVFANGKWHIVYTRFFITTIARLNTITSIPGPGDVVSKDLPNTAQNLGDIKVLEDDGNWFAYSPTYDAVHSLQRFSFGPTLFSVPTVTNIAGAVMSNSTGFGVDGAMDNGKYVLMISTLSGSIVRVDLGSDLTQPSAGETSIGNFGVLVNTLKIVLKKVGSEWSAYTIVYHTGQTYRLTFPAPTCHASVITSLQSAPTFSYDAAGTYYVTLRSFQGANFSERSSAITVNNVSVPSVAINVNGVCLSHPSSLSFTSSLPVSSVNWDLGNSTASTQTNPTLTYASTGNYDVILEATASNGCVGIASKTVSIYNPPVANFSVPNLATTCTNQLYEFANISAFDAGSSPTWQWSVDGDPVSTTEDLAQAFTSIDSYSVKLVASIPGCSSEITKPFSISEQGLPVDFTISGNCQLTDVTFDDVTPGAATEVEWDFGDGASSNNGLSTHSYLNAGVYDVVLNVTSASGCVNSATKQLTVYSLPVPAFSLDLPPFSCSGTPSQFHDATAALPDSNVQSWSWTFGDSGNGTGTGKNPTHTYTNAGQFNVGLQVTTDRGCSASKTQQVTIAQSPVASFNMDPACVNQATRLTDNSTGAVTAWQWKIGSAVYTSQNPQHTFPIPGNYSVQLTVTGENNCTNTTSRQAVVPVVPTVDFNVTNPCADQPAVFTDATASAADPVEVRNWTFGTNGNATGQSAEFAFATPGAYSTQLQVTTGSGCRYSATKQVTINPSPVASFTMSNESGPSPLSVLFANTSTGAVSHQWNFDDGTSSTETSVAHTFTQLGDHTVDLTVTNTSGCSKTESKIVTVVDPMNELALIELSWVQINSGPSWQIFIRVKNNGNYRIESFFVTYDIGGTMSFGEVVTGSLDPGEERGFFLGNTFGNPGEDAYICVALPTDENPDDNKVCSSFTGNSHIFNASPNPASDYLNIESVTAGDELLVKIYSISGALAYDRSFSVHGYTRLSLDIQNLSPGIYVIVVSTAGQTSSRKILIAR